MRSTDYVDSVIQVAKLFAKRHGRPYLDLEHLFLILAKPTVIPGEKRHSSSSMILQRHGVNFEDIKRQLDQKYKKVHIRQTTTKITLSAEVQMVITDAVALAEFQKAPLVDTDHILRALIELSWEPHDQVGDIKLPVKKATILKDMINRL